MKSILYKGSTICYSVYGNGPAATFCLHGFGEDGTSFKSLGHHTIYNTLFAIDLPFHGQSTWKKGLNVSVEDMLEVIKSIKIQEGVSLEDNHSLLGYSLGGRLALSLFEAEPASIERLILIAPDGLKMNFWYWLATQTKFGNKYFKRTMLRPQWFVNMVDSMRSYKIVNASVAKFVKVHLKDKKVRIALYNIWTAFRKFRPNTRNIKQLIIDNHTPVELVYGRFDRVMPFEQGEQLKKELNGHCRLTIVEGGHQILDKRHVEGIARFIAL